MGRASPAVHVAWQPGWGDDNDRMFNCLRLLISSQRAYYAMAIMLTIVAMWVVLMTMTMMSVAMTTTMPAIMVLMLTIVVICLYVSARK